MYIYAVANWMANVVETRTTDFSDDWQEVEYQVPQPEEYIDWKAEPEEEDVPVELGIVSNTVHVVYDN